MAEKRDYDTTLARMAGNIAAGLVGRWPSPVGITEDDIHDVALVSVDIALEIVDELKARRGENA